MAVTALALATFLTGTCSLQRGVEERLRRSTAGEVLVRYRWQVTAADDLEVALADSEGRPVSARRLPLPSTCEAQQAVAAAVLAAWLLAPPPAIAAAQPRLAPADESPGQPPARAPGAAPATHAAEEPPARAASNAPPSHPRATDSADQPTTPAKSVTGTHFASTARFSQPSAPDAPATAAEDGSPTQSPATHFASTARFPQPSAPDPAATEAQDVSPTQSPATQRTATQPGASPDDAAGSLSARTDSAGTTDSAEPAASVVPPSVASAAPVTVARPATWVEAALEAGVQYAGSVAPTLAVRVSVGRQLAGLLEVSAATPRVEALGQGSARWLRSAFGLGARYVFELHYLALEPAVTVNAGWLQATGLGHLVNATANTVDVSACGQLRLHGRVTSALSIFVGSRACAWPVAPALAVGGADATLQLPRYEVSGTLGVSGRFEVKGSSGSGPQGP